MANKEKNIKSRIELLINNIDELDSRFVTYKAELIKTLLQSILQFIKDQEQECEELKEQLNQAKYLSEGALQLYSERQNIKYKQTLDEVEEFANKACESCKKFFPNFQSDINCTCCQPSLILGIIKKTKEI